MRDIHMNESEPICTVFTAPDWTEYLSVKILLESHEIPCLDANLRTGMAPRLVMLSDSGGYEIRIPAIYEAKAVQLSRSICSRIPATNGGG